MRTTLCRGSVWAWACLPVICAILHVSSAMEEEVVPEKRIFCNFGGCHNKKRSDDSASPESIINRLFPNKFSSNPSNDTPRDLADDMLPYLTNGGKWADSAPSDVTPDVSFDPEFLSGVLRRILTRVRMTRRARAY